jgi:hypothetical protein
MKLIQEVVEHIESREDDAHFSNREVAKIFNVD